MLNALRSAGVGLCLHKKEHCEGATPSSRIFEIAASGAIAICQDHSFIRENFGDSVLYFDPASETAIKQISEHMKWIAENQEQAFSLSERAYKIYSKKYTLEKLLSDLVPRHERLVAQQKIPNARKGARKDETVQFIVRVGDRGAKYVERALDSLTAQTYGPIGVILVEYREVANLMQLLKKYDRQLHIEILRIPHSGFRSTQLWAGLNIVTSKYFGILDDDDVLHPGHVDSLLQLLEKSENYGVAYSGSIRIWESRKLKSELQPSAQLPSEPAELAYFQPFDLNRLVALDNFITSNAFIARSSLLKDLGQDPQVSLLEDLFLFLYLCRKTSFVFSYKATCEFYWADTKQDNTAFLDQQDWVNARRRIKDILWKQSFPCTQSTAHSLSQQQQRLAEVETELAQTNAKLADVTTRVNRYLNLPVIDAVRRFRRMLFRLPPPPKS